MDVKYYECHITIEPVTGVALKSAEILAERYKFRVADLLMQKRPEDTPERSKFDTFMTGRSKDYEDLHARMMNLVEELKKYAFQVWRYKIEAVVLDERLTHV